MTDSSHPARSFEFLSRRHDGELPPAEAAAFAEHLRTCEPCRVDVETYERTLSAFRGAPTEAPASDLSARILRKIRAQSPSRRPFGVMFGIDIRWAGALATALLVVIIATSLPRETTAPPAVPTPAGPLHAHLVDGADARSEGAARPAPGRERDAVAVRENAQAPSAPAAPPPPEKESRLASSDKDAAPRSREADAPRAPAAEAPVPLAARKAEARAPEALKRQAAFGEAAGGEAGAAAPAERAAAVRLVVTALDGQGAPPPLESDVSDDRIGPLRGQEFIVVLESQGRVRSVSPSGAREEQKLLQKDRADSALDEPARLGVLRELRFRAGDRPRRLLVRVE